MGSLNRVVASVCLLPRFNSRNSARPLKFGGEPTAWDYDDTDEENLENEDPIKPQSRGTYRAIASRIPPDVMNRAHAAIDSGFLILSVPSQTLSCLQRQSRFDARFLSLFFTRARAAGSSAVSWLLVVFKPSMNVFM